MYSKIVNPASGRFVSVNGKLGKEILKNYLNYSNKNWFNLHGGDIMSEPVAEEEEEVTPEPVVEEEVAPVEETTPLQTEKKSWWTKLKFWGGGSYTQGALGKPFDYFKN